MHLELLFSKHTKYLSNILHQIIQSQRFNNVFTILGGASKNMKEWICGNLRTDQINYITDSQVHTTTNNKIVTNELVNQGVYTMGVQYYNTRQESILSNIVAESYIYNNYSYASRVIWEIEKTPETPPKKLDFKINKPETGLKKIHFSIIVNNNEIDGMNNNKIDHPSDDLADDVYNNIDYQNVQQEQTIHNSLYNIADNELQTSFDLKTRMKLMFGKAQTVKKLN